VIRMETAQASTMSSLELPSVVHTTQQLAWEKIT